ncbi:MAG: hypothetical protein IJX99_04180 [Clostridia bacterium]|nr:hypothetical protein [Clostridia bacterium]
MKKVIIIAISIIMVLMLAVGVIYLIDKNRMDNNEPVIFSTWGYDYAPPINHEDITNKIPNISEVSKTTTIPLKENEDLFIDLLNGWEYEVSNEDADRYEYAINFLSPDAKNKMTLYAYKDRFGVCGTELEIKDIVLEDGNIASAGFYDGKDVWTFINFGNDLVMQNGNLTEEEAKDALSMIKTIKFVKTHPGHIIPITDELNQL